MNPHVKNLLISALLGVAFYKALMWFWAYFPSLNPIFQWMLSCCAGSDWLRPAILVHDIVINILLCIPLAIILLTLKPTNLWFIVVVAVIPSFILGNYHLRTPDYMDWQGGDFALGWVIELLSLPIAFGVVLVHRQLRNT